MPAVFHLQLARRRRWELVTAVVLTIVFAGYLVVTYHHGANPLHLALFLGAVAIFRWVVLSRLAKTPDATIELDASGIHFAPPEYWQLNRIDWSELTNLKIEQTAIWLLYRKDGAEKTRDIPRTDLTSDDCTELVASIQQRMAASSHA